MTWIKMRCNLWNHPKVAMIALRLGVTRAQVIGALHGIWSVADQHASDNGEVEMTIDALDQIVETPGLCVELERVGWLASSDRYVQFVDYQEHNSTTAKSRAGSQQRNQAKRKRDNPVTAKRNAGVTREEKRREEKIRELNTDACASLSPNGDAVDKKPSDEKKVIEAWNAMAKRCGRPATRKTQPASRVTALRARLREPDGIANILEAIERVEHSAHLRADNGGWPGATIDWILKPINLAKILEGNYDDKTPTQAKPAERDIVAEMAALDEKERLEAEKASGGSCSTDEKY